MKPFILLIAVFALGAVISRFSTSDWHVMFNGNLAMCIMLFFTAFGHFKFTAGMAMMLPGFIPFRTALVYFTGIAEMILGLALLFPAARHAAGIILTVFFILMAPANIYAAIHRVNYETADHDGKGTGYLWIRIPMQILFIGWTVYFSCLS
jgi:uncharacterized membrane protein